LPWNGSFNDGHFSESHWHLTKLRSTKEGLSIVYSTAGGIDIERKRPDNSPKQKQKKRDCFYIK